MKYQKTQSGQAAFAQQRSVAKSTRIGSGRCILTALKGLIGGLQSIENRSCTNKSLIY